MNQQFSETYALLFNNQVKEFFFFYLSFLGFFLTLANTRKIELAFLPIYVISCIIIVLYLFGLFGYLDISTQFLYYLGLLLIPLNLIRKYQFFNSLRSLFSIEHCYFFVVSFLAFYSSQGEVLYANDDFSNWGFTSKVMKETKSFVNIAFLIHPEYPPATALFQYFYTINQSFLESNLLASNAIMITASSLPILSFIKSKTHKLLLTPILFIAPWVLGANFNTLYVDTLMGLNFSTVLLFIFRSKNPTSDLNIILLIPLISLLTFTKGSGFQISLVVVAMLILLKSKNEILNIIKRYKNA